MSYYIYNILLYTLLATQYIHSVPHSLPINVHRSHQLITHTLEQTQHTNDRHLLQSTATTYTTLMGCPSADYVINVDIGGVTYRLNIDTGSTTLAVAGSTCTLEDGKTSCGIYPSYSQYQSNTSTYYGYSSGVTAEYGDGNGWYGTIYSDSVTVNNAQTVSNMKFAVIEQQIGQWFPFLDCSTALYDNTADNNQGIIGFALSSKVLVGNDSTATDSWFDLYYAQQSAVDSTFENMFALQMCQKTGNLWLGGLPPTLYQQGTLSSDNYTPYISSTGFYTVYAFDLKAITNNSVTTETGLYNICCPGGHCTGCTGIVDSGSTTFELPLTPYNTLTTYLLNYINATGAFNYTASNGDILPHPGLVTFFTPGYTSCIPTFNSTYNTTWLNQNLPELQFSLDNIDLFLKPVSSYLQEWDLVDSNGNPVTYYCNGLSTTGTDQATSGVKLGWAVLNQFTVIFDRVNSQIGFIPTDNCLSDTPHTLVETSYVWTTSDWSLCYTDTSTNQATQIRHVDCYGNLGTLVPDSYCNSTAAPATSQSCIIPTYNDVCAFFAPANILSNTVTNAQGQQLTQAAYNEHSGCVNGCLDQQTNTCQCYTRFTLSSTGTCTNCEAGLEGPNCTPPASKSWIAANYYYIIAGVGGLIVAIILLLCIRKRYRKHRREQKRRLRGEPIKQLGRGEYKPDTIVDLARSVHNTPQNHQRIHSHSHSSQNDTLVDDNTEVIPIVGIMSPSNAAHIQARKYSTLSKPIPTSPKTDIYAANTSSTDDAVVPVHKMAGPKIGDWQEFYTPQGYPYYYNARTKESVWEAPAEFFDATQ